MQKAYILHVYPWSLLWHNSGKRCCDAKAVIDVTEPVFSIILLGYGLHWDAKSRTGALF